MDESNYGHTHTGTPAGGSVDFNHDHFLNWTSTGSVPKPNRTFAIVLLCHRKVGSDIFCSVVTLT